MLSITPSFIKRKEQESPATGKLIAELKRDIDKPLSAILTLNTIAHTVGAIGVGAQAGELFGENYIDIFGFALTYESIVATVMTMAILFLSEIIPKTIGANNWKNLAGFTAKSLRILLVILTPFVWVSNQLTKLMKKDKSKSVFSKQDFAAMADVVQESGQMDVSDHQLIKNVLRFDELTAKDVMTPRTVMVSAKGSNTVQQFYDANERIIFSRIPVIDDSGETVTGVVLKYDVLQAMVDGKPDTLLSDLQRPIIHLKGTIKLREVFEKLLEQRMHMAIVVGEYGGVQGLATLEDVIETLFGLEIMDETDQVSDLQQLARDKWKQRASKMGLPTEGS